MTKFDRETLDTAIFETLGTRRMKCAGVVGDVMTKLGSRGADVSNRIIELAEAGRLLGYGDLKRIRFSEIQAPTDGQPSAK